MRYTQLKDFKQSTSPKGVAIPVRYTNAKIKADEFVKTKSVFE